MTIYNYNLGIPATNNDPSQDQPNMRINNDSIYNLVGVDHINFGNANNGKHKQVQLQTGNIPPGLINGFETLYAKVAAGNGELFFTRGLSGTEIQMTGPGAPSIIANGSTFLPGGLILQWGTYVAVATTATSKNFNSVFPNNCFGVWANMQKLTSQTSVDTVYCYGFTPAAFTYFSTSSGVRTVNWIAIGN